MLSPDDAKRFLVESSSVDLWSIGHALDRSSGDVADGVSAALAADMLQLGEPENWTRSTRDREPERSLFQPYVIGPKEGGKRYRSFLPEDLGAEMEDPVRALAASSANERVRARLFEILWDRFHKYEDALAAIDARVAASPTYDAEADWPGLVRNLGRLSTLILRLNASVRFAQLCQLLDEAAPRLLESSRPFSFPVLADMACNTIFARAEGREAFPAGRGEWWERKLQEVAETYRGDHHHGHDALVVLRAWQTKWLEQAAAAGTARRIVEHLSEIANTADAQQAPWLIQRAHQHALDFGLPDLGESMRAKLGDAIREAVPGFRQVSNKVTIPHDLVHQVESILSSAPHAAAAVRQLSVLPGLLEVDLPALRTQMQERLKDSPMLALMPTEHFHPEGRVTFRSSDPEGNLERNVAIAVGFHLVVVEALLGHVLAQSINRFTSTTLVEALAEWPHLAENRRTLLNVASERFAARDWISSTYVAATTYEGVVRDLLRAAGYPAVKVGQDGTQMDEALNSLVHSHAMRDALGDPHCDLIKYVLCDPTLGWNLRNEIAHGTVRPGSLTPARGLLIWLLLVRVTAFTAKPLTNS